MAVLVEAFSVVVRREAIDSRFAGGWRAFERTIPNRAVCWDDDLARVGFMKAADVEAYVSVLEAGGLVRQQDRQAVDFVILDQLNGPTIPAPWLEVGRLETDDIKVLACWLTGTKPEQLAVPQGWEFEGSMSQKPLFAPAGTEGDRVKFLRREDDVEVYFDYVTGKEVFLSRPAIQGDTEAALFTRLERICHRAVNLDAQSEPLKASGDMESAVPLYEELLEQLLPEAERIASGPGREMAFAHFARGLVLRILQMQEEAELSFRRANELQPQVINTLRELVRCLGDQGKHKEALPFAREATKVEPLDAGAWGNLAMCLIQCGQRAEARRAIDHAIDLDPDDSLNCYIRDNFEGYFK